MDNLLYDTLDKYFTSLANYGYRNDTDLFKILFYIFIQELVSTPSVVISEEDYRHIENALYCIYGTSCLIPYPKYCENAMYLHLGDIVEINKRLEESERSVEEIRNNVEQLGDDVDTLEDLEFVIKGVPSTSV